MAKGAQISQLKQNLEALRADNAKADDVLEQAAKSEVRRTGLEGRREKERERRGRGGRRSSCSCSCSCPVLYCLPLSCFVLMRVSVLYARHLPFRLIIFSHLFVS